VRKRILGPIEMNCSVTVVTQGDKISLCICTELSAGLKMVDMKVLSCPTELAAPTITLEHTPM
jgi:hypothetical protein